jgi:O-antigen/teichoic acid export membrane protein
MISLNWLKKQAFGSQIRRNASAGTLSTVINSLVMLVSYPLYLHCLGYEKYGVWIVLATVFQFAQIADFGVPSSITKFVAEGYARKDITRIRGYLFMGIALLCVPGLISLTGIIWLRTEIIALFGLAPENSRLAVWLLPYIAFLTLYVYIVLTVNAVLPGIGRMDLANYIQSMGRGVACGSSVLMLWRGLGVESLLIGTTMSYALVHIASFIAIRRALGAGLMGKARIERHDIRRFLKYSSEIFGGLTLATAFHPLTKLLISRYAGVDSVTIYEIAVSSVRNIRTLIVAALRALFPEFSRLSALGSESAYTRMETLNSVSLKVIWIISLPLFIPLFAFAPSVLELWLGGQLHLDLANVFKVILVAEFISLQCVPAFYTLLGMGKTRTVLGSRLIEDVLNVCIILCMVLLSGSLSVLGVAFSILAVRSIACVYVLYYGQRAITYSLKTI